MLVNVSKRLLHASIAATGGGDRMMLRCLANNAKQLSQGVMPDTAPCARLRTEHRSVK